MITANQIFDFLFCCLSPEQQAQIDVALANNLPAPIYEAQTSLIKEKQGYRCNKCGKIYPLLQLDHEGILYDPAHFSKNTKIIRKGKKAAVIFQNHGYYAYSKNTLLKMEPDTEGNYQQTDEIPIMKEVYHAVQSPDERYIATETFRDTIDIIDSQTKQSIAKRRKTPLNGQFIFTEDNQLLYFFREAIHCWDFLHNSDEVIWQAPQQWKTCGDSNKEIRIGCKNVLYNSLEHTYLFQCCAGNTTYLVFIQDLAFIKAERIENVPTLCELVYSPDTDRYTLPLQDSLVIYDSVFQVAEKLCVPQVLCIQDGGGMFPISRHKSRCPYRAFLSPNGKWLLLDYFNYAVLMNHESKEIKFCLYSHTGKVAQRMGFVDNDHFWYTWGDTTYIRQISAMSK